MKLSDELIKEIAQELEMGMRCYVHKTTNTLITLPNEEASYYADMELWQQDMDQVENNRTDYHFFEVMDAHASFKVMANFAETVSEPQLYRELTSALDRPKPFRNFKWIIDNSGDYRQEWFAFKSDRYIQFVKQNIELIDEE